MSACAPSSKVILSALLALLAYSAPSYGKCELKKLGGLFSAESFVDSDADKTIKVKIDGLLDPKVSVTYSGRTIVISYSDYTTAVRDCGNGTFPDWFASLTAEKLPSVEQGARVPIVTASSDLDIGDLDEDGDTDAVGIRFFQGVTVSLANPAGAFPRVGVLYPTGAGPETLVLADLNRDGRDDILVADVGNFRGDPGKLSVLLGLSNGTFAPAVSFPAGVAPMSVAAGDFNGDGNLDAALAAVGTLGAPNLPADSGSVAVLLGNGQGGFGAATILQTGEQPISILATDLDADGKLDLAVANRASDNVSLLFGNGNGTFQAAVHFAVGSRPAFLGSADFNGDGRADLAVLHPDTATISMWMNAGNRSFTSAGRYIAGSSVASFAIADSPNDARPTILSPDGQQILEPLVQLNASSQVVAAPIDLSSDADIMVLQLFGTGLRRRLNLSDVRVLINGVQCNVLYAGSQNQFPGLDQINIELPKSLRGAGLVRVVVEVEGQEANVLQIRIG